MKRSEINEILQEAQAFIQAFGGALPPFATLSPEALAAQDHAEIAARGLGWDITDYGTGRFAEVGLVLFTLRNGRAADLGKRSAMLYAEKLMISRQGQVAPNHRHALKVEDIVNRGGGTLVVELHAADAAGGIDRESAVTVMVDGARRSLSAGGRLRLAPGESVTLHPHHWHAFWAEDGDVLIGEISTVNDDLTDNIFEHAVGRFPEIEEDAPPLHLLVSDYATRL